MDDPYVPDAPAASDEWLDRMLDDDLEEDVNPEHTIGRHLPMSARISRLIQNWISLWLIFPIVIIGSIIAQLAGYEGAVTFPGRFLLTAFTVLSFDVMLIWFGFLAVVERKVLLLERFRRNMVRSVTQILEQIIEENPVLVHAATLLWQRYRRYIPLRNYFNRR